MEHKLAKRMAETFARQGHIPSEKIPVYQYGFELFISSVISVLLILVIGLIFMHPGYALIYLVGFIPIRVCAGGYHGKTHLECYLVFSLTFAACMALLLKLVFVQFFPVITCTVLLLAMMCLAPVEAKNKPLTPERRRRNHRHAVTLSSVDLVIAFTLFVFHFEFNSLAFAYYLSKWIVILFTIWPVAYESVRKLVCVEQ